MIREEEAERSFWQTTEMPSFSPLVGDQEMDVCVIGAGIAGLSIAYHLSREGRNVCILDDGEIGGGQTGRTTAHFTYALDDRYYKLYRLHGPDRTRLAAESHVAAIESVREILNRERIDCEAMDVDGYLFLSPEHTEEDLDRELAILHQMNFHAVTKEMSVPFSPFPSGPCLRFPRQLQLHPMKYLAGLVRAIIKQGGTLHTSTRVCEVKGGIQPEVKTEHFSLRAQKVVVATNVPLHHRWAIHTKQAAYRTYVVVARVPKGYVPPMLLWDTGLRNEPNNYHYVRMSPLNERFDLLLVGGEDHKTGQAYDMILRFDRLKKWARQRFPEIVDFPYQWSGQIIEPIDGMAFIGEDHDEENVYLVTGDSGNGMTHGALAGLLISDLIQGRPNLWAPIYRPNRLSWLGIGEYVSENANALKQYLDYFRGGEVDSIAKIPRGEGRTLRRGAELIAVYKDERGKIYEWSAVCPHLGAIVHWNQAEKTWDCPAHGSRFNCYGHMINGPAFKDLRQVHKVHKERGIREA